MYFKKLKIINFQKSGLDNLEEDVYFSVTDVRGGLNAYT